MLQKLQSIPSLFGRIMLLAISRRERTMSRLHAACRFQLGALISLMSETWNSLAIEEQDENSRANFVPYRTVVGHIIDVVVAVALARV